MMKRMLGMTLGVAAVSAAVWASTPLTYQQARLDADELKRVHASVAPKGEKWTEIPWQTDLREARRLAAETKKPLFMWIMDGHPLGCT